MRALLIMLLTVAVALTPSAMAQEPARIALLIGNLAYKPDVGRLKNPHNDIAVVGAALKASGFRVLEPLKDATRAQVLRAVREFAEQLKAAGPNAVGLLYYSGHGAAIGSSNYLIPIDVEKPDAATLADGGVLQREIIDRLIETAPLATHYLVIDACRNNLGGTKGPKGFRPERRRDGMLIAFAAEPDRPASDDGDIAGPFAAAFAAELAKPAQLDLLLFHNVRVAVDQRTKGEQVPWIEDGIRRAERVRLGKPGPGGEVGTLTSPAAPIPSPVGPSASAASNVPAPTPPVVHSAEKIKLYVVSFAPNGKLESPPYTDGTIRNDYSGYAGVLVRDDRGTFEIRVTDVKSGSLGSLRHECTGGQALSVIKVGDIVRMKPANCTTLTDTFVPGAAFAP